MAAMSRSFPYPWCIASLTLFAGCVTVDPRPDLAQSAGLIAQRTGSPDVYDPTTEAQIAAKVRDLLENGLSVEEAVRVALLNNRELQAAFQTIGVSRAELVQSGLLTNPSFSLLGRLPESGGRANLELGFAQQIADLWQIPVRKEVARAQLESTILNVAHLGIGLAAAVRARCYELLTLREVESALRENLELVEQSVRLAERQYEAGAVSKLDVNLVRLNTLDVRLELITLQREQRVAEAQLVRLLSLTDGSPLPSLIDTLPTPRPLPREALLSTALAARLDVRQAAATVDAAEADLRRESLRVFPSIEFGLALERPDRQSLPGRNILADTVRESVASGALTAPGIESRAQRDLQRRQIVDVLLGPSVALTVPLWDQNQAQMARARFVALQRCKEYEELLNRVAAEVTVALATLETAEELVHFYETEALPQIRETVEGARRIYEAGEGSILVILQAQATSIARRRAYARALGEYAAARVELERAVGGHLPEPSTTQPATRSRVVASGTFVAADHPGHGSGTPAG